MADKELSTLTAASKPDGTEIVMASQGVNSRKLTSRQLAALGLEMDSQAGTAYTAVVGDNGKFIRFTNAAAITLTIDNSVHSAGDEVSFQAYGAGAVTVVAGAGVTLRTPNGTLVTPSQYAVGHIRWISASEAIVDIDTFGAASATEFTMVIAASDEAADLTTGTAKVTFRMPAAVTLTGVRANVNTAATGALLTVDINEAGVTILSTKITLDIGAKTSVGAATPAVISDSALADDAEMTIDIDVIGSTIAGAGLKVTLIGTYT